MTPVATSDLAKVTWNVWEGEPTTLDPFLSADYTPNMINSNMCENLLAQQPDFSITPDLAQSFSNPDPLHWVYHLRTDVKFWDGSPMTAEDVAWSLNHNLTDKASLYNYLFANVKSVDVTGPAQVTVSFTKPDYLFNTEMADYAGVIVEKKFYLAHAAQYGSPDVGVMCTGPFKFVNWVKGQSITLAKNTAYWNTSLKPKVSTLVFTFLTNESSITSALESGQIDGTYSLPMSGLQQLEKSKVGTVYQGAAPLELTFSYCNPQGLMANPKLRQALQMAIDWQGISKTIMKGTATPMRAQDPTTVFGYASSQLLPAYNALPAPQSAQYAAAKALVKSSGADLSRQVVMAVNDTATTQQFGNSIVAAGREIGLNMKLKVVPAAQYTNYLYDPKTRVGVDMLYTDFWPNVADPMDWFGITSLTGGSFNQWGYSGINDLYAQAQGTKDDAARAAILVKIQAKLRSDLLPMVPGVNHTSTVWLNKRITGVPATFSYVYYPWAADLGGTG